MKEGWIKLHRKILDSDMYQQLNSKQRDVLVTCLLLANHEAKSWVWKNKPFKLKAGSFITSLESIQKQCGRGMSLQNIRTALNVLQTWSFLTNESTNEGRMITICKWVDYQQDSKPTNKPTNSQLTGNQQAVNRQLTTTKNIRSKEEKKGAYGNFSSKEEYMKAWYEEHPERRGMKLL
jgi:DNA replication protein DnaD